jgi:serine/threonine-protein kinase
MMVGTPDFMAPEQARGQAVGPATDLYALGIMAFEMLTKKLPFEAPTPFEVIYKHMYMPAPRLSALVAGVPPAFDNLVARLLEKSPEARPGSADEVRALLEEIRGEVPAPSPRQSLPGLAGPPTSSSPAEVRPVLGVTAGNDPARRATSAEQAREPAPPRAAPAVVAKATVPAPAAPSPPAAAAPVAESSEPLDVLPRGKGGKTVVIAALAGVAIVGVFMMMRKGTSDPVDAPATGVSVPKGSPATEAPPGKAPAPSTAPAAAPSAPVETAKAAPAPEKPVEAVAKGPGQISLTSNVPCDVLLDGRPLGRTPLSGVSVEAGRRTFRCRSAFSSEVSADVEVEPGTQRSGSFAFRAGKLEVMALPFAEVAIDGKAYGETPIKPVDLVEGTHRVVLTMDAKKLQRVVTLKGGEQAKLKVDMETEH